MTVMRFGHHTLVSRLSGRVANLGNRLSRARYFRGHGVHSPFVYAIVREVFMRRELLEGDRSLYEALCCAGIPHRRAVQLQNLAIHCHCAHWALNRADADLCIMTRDLSWGETFALVRAASVARHTVVVLAPYEGRERQALCARIVSEHRSTTVDNRGYLIVFNNHLPKQHFRI